MNRGEEISVQPTVPDDFSLLPNEIIHDVVNSHGAKRSNAYYKLENLVQIEGSWGAFARELSACTMQDYDLGNVVFLSRVVGSSRKKKIPFEDALNRNICDSWIEDNFDLEQLTVLAPILYEVIYFYTYPDTYGKTLDLMGTRFTRITWRGGDSKKPPTPDLVHFLRRQLRSNYLRDLDVTGLKFEDGAFDKEFVVFVTRPWFEKLCMRGAWCHVPFEVIEGAHKSWEAPKFYELNERVISAYISRETLGKIEEYFEKKFEFLKGTKERELNIRHPEESNANFCFRVAEVNDYYRINAEARAIRASS